VPWCAECARFLSPSTVRPDGACPSCGREVDPGRARPPGDPAPRRRRNRLAHRGVGDTCTAPGPGGDGATNADRSDADSDDEELPAVPWHLKALAGGLVVYLGYRFMQGVEWVWHRIG